MVILHIIHLILDFFFALLILFLSSLIHTTATGGALAAGTALGWTAQISKKVVSKPGDPFGEYNFFVSQDNWSWVGSVVPVGAALICIFIGTIIQVIGRKLTMLLLVVPFTIGWALVIFATNVPILLVGRFLLGISGGAFCVAAPTYTAEIAQSDIRGTLGSYFQLMMVIGILFVYVVGAFASVFALSIICGVIPLIFGGIFVFMPETPLYLISKGRKEEAAKSLKWLRGSEYDYSEELAELQQQHEEEKGNKVSIGQALKRRATKKAIVISLGLMFFQQMSGINAVIFFTGDIFEAANTGIPAYAATIIVGVMQVIGVFVSSLIVDRAGRRLLLLPSIVAMTICTVILGGYFYAARANAESVANLGIIPIVSMSVFIILFSIGFGPIPWMMMGELFANDIKGLAGSVAGAFNWSLAFLITSTFVPMKNTFGDGPTFWIFGGFCVVGTLFVFFFVPETKGKSLPEIQLMLGGEKSLSPENGNPKGVSDSKF